jgi:anti-anti-sigma factor
VTGSTFSHQLTAEPSRLTLSGELDEATTFELRELIGTGSAGLQKDLVVDLSAVDFLPSAAVGVLAKARATAQANGATITFAATEGSIAQRVLTICGLPHEDA